MKELGLPELAVRATTVDELATVRQISHGAMTASVKAGDLEAHGLLMLPYEDKRTRPVDIDGSLGMNFFAPYNIVANWHKKTLWLTPRATDPAPLAADRIRRWGRAFDACKHPGCVAVAVESDQPAPAANPGVQQTAHPEQSPGPAGAESKEPAPEPAPAAGEPAPPAAAPAAPPPPAPPAKYTLRVHRDADAPPQAYDVLVEARDAGGKPLGLPRLLVTMPAGQPEVLKLDFDPAYGQAASFVVLDVSPFPRECRDNDCVFTLGPMR